MDSTISYLKAYGIEKTHNDLLYKRLSDSTYIVAYIKYDIDVFLCRWLPESSEHTDDANCVIDKIMGFRIYDSQKMAEFKKIISST